MLSHIDDVQVQGYDLRSSLNRNAYFERGAKISSLCDRRNQGKSTIEGAEWWERMAGAAGGGGPPTELMSFLPSFFYSELTGFWSGSIWIRIRL